MPEFSSPAPAPHWTESGKYGPHRPIASISYRNSKTLEDDMNYIALNSGRWACDTVVYQGVYGYLCVYNYVPEIQE